MAAYDIVLTAKGEPKPIKLPTKAPKAMGPLVDAYKAWSERRLAEAKKADAFATQEKALKAYIIDNVPKGDGGAIGDKYKAVVYNDPIVQVEDWDKLFAYIKKNDAFELLGRSLNAKAVEEHMEALNVKRDEENAKLVAKGKPAKPRILLPGTKIFNAVKLSVTKK